MSFPWYEAKMPDHFRATFPERLLAMQRRAVRDHAALLRSLGWSKKRALARCKANAEWEYELLDRPTFLDEIDQLVDKAYGR